MRKKGVTFCHLVFEKRKYNNSPKLGKAQHKPRLLLFSLSLIFLHFLPTFWLSNSLLSKYLKVITLHTSPPASSYHSVLFPPACSLLSQQARLPSLRASQVFMRKSNNIKKYYQLLQLKSSS